MNKQKLVVFAVFAGFVFLVYKQWTRKGSATFGDFEPIDPSQNVDVNHNDPNVFIRPADPIGAPGSQLPTGEQIIAGDVPEPISPLAPLVGTNPAIPGVLSFRAA